jgi:two-component system NtrC family response regulator
MAEMVADGNFREDLFYRLNIVPIEIPPLRKRRDDIPLLINHFLSYFCSRYSRSEKRFTPEAMAVLAASPWPGNTRQLRNVIERLVVTAADDVIAERDLPSDLTASKSNPMPHLTTLAEVTEAAERAAIESALSINQFHREQTAKSLGISVRTLHYKMSRYGIH